MKIEALSAETATGLLPDLAVVLMDAVRNGASVGFLEPLGVEEATAYWRKVIAEIPSGGRVLFGAFDPAGQLVGTAQLALEARANGRHRAEVQKVLVRLSARRRGVGARLMERIEAEAMNRGRRLLFLDTSTGPGGATEFYAALGYTLAGGIPDYAADPNGRLVANAIFHKQLGPRIAALAAQSADEPAGAAMG